MNALRQQYGITIVPPAVGAAPRPPLALLGALDTLEIVRARPRSTHDHLTTGLHTVVRQVRSLLAQRPYRARAHGLSAAEASDWAAMLARLLSAAERGMMLDYIRASRDWESDLQAAIGTGRADPDWDMTSAKNVPASAPEAYLARTLAEVGIPVQAQVGVAQARGGQRRGGWYGAYWLDCAHRDPAYLLRINIELDGKYHYTEERWLKDRKRNEVLAQRGWYVLRISGRVLGGANHQAALERLAVLVERHRRAVVLARSPWDVVAAALG